MAGQTATEHALAPSAGATPSTNVRVRAKLEMRREILDAARRALAEEGPAGVRFRAVARDVGLVSSGVYRYFPGRDALLTALIIESYDALGDRVETAERAVPRTAFAQRFRAVARAARRWARAQPQQWSLIFGSPIPGYDAPTDTVRAATRLPLALAGILHEAYAAGAVKPATSLLPDAHDALELRTAVPEPVPTSCWSEVSSLGPIFSATSPRSCSGTATAPWPRRELTPSSSTSSTRSSAWWASSTWIPHRVHEPATRVRSDRGPSVHPSDAVGSLAW